MLQSRGMGSPHRHAAAAMLRLCHVGVARRTVLLALTEAGLIAVALAVAVRLSSAGTGAEGTGAGLWLPLLSAFLGALCLYYCDLYDSAAMASGFEVSARLLQAVGLLFLVTAGLNDLLRPSEWTQGGALVGVLLAAVVLAGWRGVFWLWNHSDRLAQPTLLFGDGPLAMRLAAEIQRRPELGLHLVGCFSPGAPPGAVDCDAGNRLLQITRRERVARIVITMEERRGQWPAEELLCLKNDGVRIEDGTEAYEAITGRIAIESLRYSQILFARGFTVSAAMRCYKRAASLALACLALILAAPLMLAAAIAIRLDSPGPVIFRQRRVGWRGQLFTLYKFRSMYVDVDANGQHLPARLRDPRITRVGRWLRRTRWDELPQLFNILRGDMHFVGPRPFVLNQERELEAQIPFYRQRWAVRPGATGWAQVHRGYCATLADNEEKLSYDLFYIKNMSFSLDLLILLQTVKILLLGRGGR